MRNILVTAISGDVANGILKCLKESEDNLYGCDVYDYPVGMDKVITYWKSEFAYHEKYISSLLDKCKEYQISHIIPVNEKEIEVINTNRHVFEENKIKLVMNDKDIINEFLDKKKTIQRLSTIDGIDVPQIYKKVEPGQEGKKYIVKPRKSCGSKELKIIQSQEEWNDISDQENYVLQEYIDAENEEYTVGVFSNGEKVSVIAYRRKLENGYTAFVELVHDEKMIEIANRIAASIHLKGYINIQLRKKEKCYYIFEINPRISGTVYFREMLGFHDVKWWLDLVDGYEEYSYQQVYKRAIGMRELSEKYVVLE